MISVTWELIVPVRSVWTTVPSILYVWLTTVAGVLAALGVDMQTDDCAKKGFAP